MGQRRIKKIIVIVDFSSGLQNVSFRFYCEIVEGEFNRAIQVKNFCMNIELFCYLIDGSGMFELELKLIPETTRYIYIHTHILTLHPSVDIKVPASTHFLSFELQQSTSRNVSFLVVKFCDNFQFFFLSKLFEVQIYFFFFRLFTFAMIINWSFILQIFQFSEINWTVTWLYASLCLCANCIVEKVTISGVSVLK